MTQPSSRRMQDHFGFLLHLGRLLPEGVNEFGIEEEDDEPSSFNEVDFPLDPFEEGPV